MDIYIQGGAWERALRVRRRSAPGGFTAPSGRRAAQEVRPTVLATWRGPWGDAPKPGEPVAARIQAYDYRRDLYGELLFIGEPGKYRVHEIEYEKRISMRRRWQEREKDWDAARSSASRDHSP